jgi:hypothetical protein
MPDAGSMTRRCSTVQEAKAGDVLVDLGEVAVEDDAEALGLAQRGRDLAGVIRRARREPGQARAVTPGGRGHGGHADRSVMEGGLSGAGGVTSTRPMRRRPFTVVTNPGHPAG